MFREYLGPSSGCTTLCIQQLVLIIFLDGCLLSRLYCNPNRTTGIYLKRIISTACFIHAVVTPDGGPRYTRNMKRLTKYTKNKLYIKLVFLYTIKRFYLRGMKFLPVPCGFGVWSGFRSSRYVLQRIYISFLLGIKPQTLKQ